MRKNNYHKRIGLDGLKHTKDLRSLESIILRLGYTSSDYKVNYFGNSSEMIISNQNLHRDLKTIRRTMYNKSNKSNNAK